ncbi:MAG: transposase [Flavobacteriales bacterium]
MKQRKFTEVQIVKILSEQNQGKTVNEICREHGISQGTFYQWKSIRRHGKLLDSFLKQTKLQSIM